LSLRLIVHDATQPENIMMGKMGTIKLGDFGISKQLSSATTHTMHGGTSTMTLCALFRAMRIER
jgi:serine/threonine protein kinase